MFKATLLPFQCGRPQFWYWKLVMEELNPVEPLIKMSSVQTAGANYNIMGFQTVFHFTALWNISSQVHRTCAFSSKPLKSCLWTSWLGFCVLFLPLKLPGFLITVISVCRISEPNALSITSSYLLFHIEMVVLNLMLFFVPKVNWNFLFSSCGKGKKKACCPFI